MTSPSRRVLSGRPLDVDFTDRVAVVTGAARGIGLRYVRGFAAHGARVVLGDFHPGAAQAAASDLENSGFAASGYDVDVADEDAVRRFFEQVAATYGRVDFLVNNAALMLDVDRPFKPFWETSWDEWMRVMAVTAGGVHLCCTHVKPLMERQRGGSIVNVSSDAIWRGYAGQLAYFAAKGAVAVMTRCLAREMGPFDVRVNAVAPGFTLSEAVLASEFLQTVARPAVNADAALAREQYPEDLVGAVLFLCSPAARSITGQTIVINRGTVMV